jgi:hypothetical protein
VSEYQPYPTSPPPLGPPGEIVVRSLGEEPPPRRRTGRVVVAAVAAAVLVALAVALPIALRDEPPSLAAVTAYDDLRTDHVTGSYAYEVTPPVGGPHDDRWLDCGVYDEPVRDENAVHDLEHGTVWITYRPDLPDDDVEALADALPQNGILSPYDDLPAPVVVTVWGRQLRLDGADDERLTLFVEEYADGVTAPEPMQSCAGGVEDPSGGSGIVT